MPEINLNHKHIYRILPVNGTCKDLPQDVQVWLRCTTVTNPIITSKVNNYTVDENYIYVDEYQEERYGRYPYNANLFPNKLRDTFQRINFKYHFETNPFGMVYVQYDYTFDCPVFLQEDIQRLITAGKTDAEIIAIHSDYDSTDMQAWITAIKASAPVVTTSGTNTIVLQLTQHVQATQLIGLTQY